MIKMRHFKKLVIIALVCALLLTACSDAEWELIEEFFVVWAEENGLFVDDELQIDKAATTLIKNEINNVLQPEENIQLDGLDVIKDIEKADELSNQALEDFDPEKMQSALKIRPDDWRLHEDDAALAAAQGDVAGVMKATARSDQLVIQSVKFEENCLAVRRAQLETRLETTWSAILAFESRPENKGMDAVLLRELHTTTRDELKEMNEFSESPFCKP